MSEKWNVENIPSQSGKIALVTGANSGLGFETTRILASKGMTVIMACRNPNKAHEAINRIKKEQPNAQLNFVELDLSRLNSVGRFAKDIHDKFERLDLLINNAGIMMIPQERTTDGFEKHLAVNYLNHFALTGLLLDLLLKTDNSRIVSLSSLSYKWADIQFEDLHFSKEYSKPKAYGQSKRACLVFAYELQRRFASVNSKTISVAAHPGLSNTNLDRHFPKLIRPLGALFLQSQKKGALSILYAATELSLTGGEYIGPSGFKELRGYPEIIDSDERTKDAQIGNRLWDVSEELTKVKFLFNQ